MDFTITYEDLERAKKKVQETGKLIPIANSEVGAD
jgi:hypothetical protein